MKRITDRVEALLQLIVRDRDSHSRWLNTLSFLEHIGSRKIIKSQASKRLDLVTLGHIAEETRHAWFFKRLSHRVSPDLCQTYEDHLLLEGPSAERYFQKLDARVRRELKGTPHTASRKALLNYLYVTLLVEERALWLYRLYRDVLHSNQIKLSLRTVLSEEEGHLEHVLGSLEQEDRDFQERAGTFRGDEAVLFEGFVTRVERALSSSP